MEENQLQMLVRQQINLRIGREMAAYLAGQIQPNAHPAPRIPVIGGDARTGVARRLELPVDCLRAMLDAPPS